MDWQHHTSLDDTLRYVIIQHQVLLAYHETFRSVIIQLKVLLAPHETFIRDHYGRPKGGSSLRYSWLTMRPPLVIIMADRKVAPA